MRIVEVTNNFSRNGINYIAGKKFVMPEDIESQLRGVAGNCVGMSHPFEGSYKRYNGEDLTGKRLAFIRQGGIGDISFLSSIPRFLKKKYPGCYIKVATGCPEPLISLPEVDEIHPMPFDEALLKDCDHVNWFQGILESSSEKSKITPAVDMFFSYFGIDSTQFPAEEKRPRIVISEAEQKWAKEECQRLGITAEDLVIGIQMETSAPLRNYPKEKFKVIVDILAREEKTKVVLVGSPQQAMVGSYLKGNNPNVIVATNYDVRKSIVLTSRYNIVVAPDSFMIQVAGGLEKPLIGLYGPFPSDVRMKYFKNAIALEPKVVCSPCFKHDFRPCIKGFPSPCFSLVSPEEVLQALDFQRNKFYGGHFNYMSPLLKQPDFSEVEQYFLSADKGLCFFGTYFSHPNMIKVDTNKFVKADITDLNHPFEHSKYPFILYMNDIGHSNGSVYGNCKKFVRSGGYFIVYRDSCPEQMFVELKKDIGKDFSLLYSKFDPTIGTGLLVGRKSF